MTSREEILNTGTCRFYATFTDLENTPYTCLICQKGFSGISEEVATLGDPPLTISWSGADMLEPIVKSTAALRLYSNEDMRFFDLYNIGEFETVLYVYRGNALYWVGFLDAEQYEEPYSFKRGYITELAFSDFAPLERVKFPAGGMHSLKEVVSACVHYPRQVWDKKVLRLPEADASLVSTVRKVGELNGKEISGTAYEYAYIDCANWIDADGEPLNCLKVLTESLRPFALRIEQRGGAYGLYDLHAAATDKGTPGELTAMGTDARIYADRVYRRAKVSISPCEPTELGKSKEIPTEGASPLPARVFNRMDDNRFISHTLKTYWRNSKENETYFQGLEFEAVPGTEGSADSGVLLMSDNVDYVQLISNIDPANGKSVLTNNALFVRYTATPDKADPIRMKGSLIWTNQQPDASGVKYGWSGKYFCPDYKVPGNLNGEAQAGLLKNFVHTFIPALKAKAAIPFRSEEVKREYLLGIKFERFLSRSCVSMYNNDAGMCEHERRNDFGDCYWRADAYALNEEGERILRFNTFRPYDPGYSGRPPMIGEPDYPANAWEFYEKTAKYTADKIYLPGCWDKDLEEKGGIPLRAEKVPAHSWSSGFGKYCRADLRKDYVCFPLPPAGVSVEVVLYGQVFATKEVQMHDLKDAVAPGVTFFVLNKYAVRDLEIGILRLDGRNDEDEDIELQAWINREAAEEAPDAELYLSSSEALRPVALTLLRDKDGARAPAKWRRGANGIEGTTEELYFSTVFSNHAERRNKISGTYRPLHEFRTVKESGRRYLITEESCDLRAAESEMTLSELVPDTYKPKYVKMK